MADQLWVGTRKGLFRLRHVREAGWQVVDIAFKGSPVSAVLHDPRDGSLYAALNLGHFGVKLHRSPDGGQTWQEMTAPSYPVVEGETGLSVKQIWAIEPAGPTVEEGLWIGTIPGDLFKSTDGGQSWQLNTALAEDSHRKQWFGGGADDPAIHSICVDPRDSRKILLGVSCGGVWRSEDGGQSWAIGGPGMIAEYMPPDQQDNPHVQDPHRLVQCPSSPDHLWVQHHNGVFRSTDWAESWERVQNLAVSEFGFAVAVHPHDPQTAWFVPAIKDEVRIPVDGKLVVTRTRDGGATSEALTEGLPQDHCYDLVFRHAMDIDATGQRLAFGSTTGHVYVTENGGDDWQELPWHLPPIYVVRFGGA